MQVAGVIHATITIRYKPHPLTAQALVIDPNTKKIAYVGDSETAFVIIQQLYSSLNDQEYFLLDGTGNHVFVYPGLIDAHIHVEALSNKLFWPNLTHCRTKREVVETVEHFVQTNLQQKPISYVVGYGWNDELWEEQDRYFWNAIDLDHSPILRNVPVVLFRRCLHVCLLNQKAMDLTFDSLWSALTTDETQFVRKDRSGRLTGICVEKAAFLIQQYLSVTSRVEERALKIDMALEHLSSFGITSVQTNDANAAWKVYHYLLQSSNDHSLPVRVYLTPMWDELFDLKCDSIQQPHSWEEELPSYLVPMKTGIGNRFLRWGRIKLFADGSLGAKTAALLDPYEGEKEDKGNLLLTLEECGRKVTITEKFGWQCETHAIGDAAVEMVSQAYDENCQKASSRPVLTHVQMISPKSIDLMRRSHVIANIQPSFLSSDYQWILSRIGTRRLAYAYAWKTLQNNQILLSGSSDAPVEDASPWKGIFSAVYRQDEELKPHPDGWQSQEKLSITDAFSLYTENAAFAEYSENEKGCLLKGYLADFIILQHDVFSLSASDLLNVSVMATVMDGKVRCYKEALYDIVFPLRAVDKAAVNGIGWEMVFENCCVPLLIACVQRRIRQLYHPPYYWLHKRFQTKDTFQSKNRLKRTLRIASRSNMSTDSSIENLTKELLEQDEKVRKYRMQSCEQQELSVEEEKLRELHRKLNRLLKENGLNTADDSKMQSEFPREALEGLLRRRFFFAPSFEIYGGVAGLYDYGPPGTAMKNNMIQIWRQHFVVEENMLELEGTSLTPDVVLRASGHIDKFSDFLVKDLKTGDCFRADHLLKEQLKKVIDDSTVSSETKQKAEDCLTAVDEMDFTEMEKQLKNWNVVSPDTGNELSEPQPFNLMFQTSIGPTGMLPGFLRPETAQGIFVNFRRLLDYQGDKLPFACAQVGSAFRNEIAPRSGLLREFTQAEIEHFVHPGKKEHPKMEKVRQVMVTLFPRRNQMSTRRPIRMTIGEAVEQKIVDNETLGYFIARTHLFAIKIGLDGERIRFRQHLQHEMAHYAKDCWDLEVESSYGWIECAGLADRACYDLQNHTEKSHVDLMAFEVFPDKRQVNTWVAEFQKGLIGKHFASVIMKAIEETSDEEKQQLGKELESKGFISLRVGDSQVEIGKEMLTLKPVTKFISGESYYPSVIEPSFGIGRLVYCVWEHNFYIRSAEDEQRAVLSLPATVAPYKCTVLPLSKNVIFQTLIQHVSEMLTSLGIQYNGVSIGKRYSRADELGIPFAITIDFQSVHDQTITLRERDSTKQVRGPLQTIVEQVPLLSEGKISWKNVLNSFPVFDASAVDSSKDA
eukprot:jgi/Galph1/1189/GphlegSOOS_G6051.1